MADATVSEVGTKALYIGAVVLAKLGLSLIQDEKLLDEVKKEQKEKLAAIGQSAT